MIWIIFIAIIIFLIITISNFWFIKRESKKEIDLIIDKDKINKILLNKSNIDYKYLKYISGNINIINILDTIDYQNFKYCIDIMGLINSSEENINSIYEDLQKSSINNKIKIIWFRNIINKEKKNIENNYIKIINEIFDKKNNDNQKIMIQLINGIKRRIQKIRFNIETTIANEERDEVEVWKSEIDRLNDYIYLDESFQKIIESK